MGPRPLRLHGRDVNVLVWAASMFVALAFSCQAQEPPTQDLLKPETTKPAGSLAGGVVIGSPDERLRSSGGPCVEVEIGGVAAAPLDCLNRKLKNQVDRVQRSTNTPPLDAKSQDIKVGATNSAAVRQQYGANFGVSPFPQRPAAPTFVNPVGRH